MHIKQIFGLVLYYSLAKHLPRSSFKLKFGRTLRGFCGKLIFLDCGKKINIEKDAVFSRKCSIGDYSGIGYKAEIGVTHIGKYVMMGPYCKIYTQNHNHDRTDIPMAFQGNSQIKPVIIGDDVWIGANVIILPGIEIGRGSIIGAGSVVTKSVPPFSVCCGNPAVVKKRR